MDNGNKIGIDIISDIQKDFEFGLQIEREIGIKKSDFQSNGKSLIVSAGSTSSSSYNSLFNELRPDMLFYKMRIAPNGDIYAITNNNHIYFKSNNSDTNDFYLLSNNLTYTSITIDQNTGTVYVLNRSFVYKRVNGQGTFVFHSQTPLNHAGSHSIAIDINGDLWVCNHNGSAQTGPIYKQISASVIVS